MGIKNDESENQTNTLQYSHTNSQVYSSFENEKRLNTNIVLKNE